MEKTVLDCEQKTLIGELNQGMELAKQLMNHIHRSSSHETREVLIGKILSSYEKALSALNWGAFVGQTKPIVSKTESPSHFGNSSPRSEGSDPEYKHREVYKKRKTLPKWTEQVKVVSGTGLEGPVDDGYSWRKYGQKEILGASFPRGYYRCTHRNAQGCLATKQVQRSDGDPTIFEVNYRGRHTCSQSSRFNMAPSSRSTSEGLKENRNTCHPKQQPHEEEKPPQEIVSEFGLGHLVKAEELENGEDDKFPIFSFPSTPIESENADDNIFFESSMLNSHFIGSLSPTFISPATSESNIFCMSPCHINSHGLCHNLHTSESDHTDIISAPTSAANSPIGNFDFSLDLDPYFQFDNPEFFS
nr:WRKY65 [Juglans sigillata]